MPGVGVRGNSGPGCSQDRDGAGAGKMGGGKSLGSGACRVADMVFCTTGLRSKADQGGHP